MSNFASVANPAIVKRFAVIGHPVAHSLSPKIHAAFGKQTGIALEYIALDAAPEHFDALLAEFAAEGGLGANVTLPHKTRAASSCTTLTERARRAAPRRRRDQHADPLGHRLGRRQHRRRRPGPRPHRTPRP